jgi:hypothetical protein
VAYHDGPQSAGTAATATAGAGSTDWTDPASARTPDTSYAASAMADSGGGVGASYYLNLTGFGFAIPSDATVIGIVVHWSAAENADVTIASTRLLKAGVAAGTDYGAAAAGSLTKESGSYYGYGGAADLWGTTWTPAQVNASDFGVRLAFSTAAAPKTAEVGHAIVTVRYLDAAERVYTVSCGCCGGGDPCCPARNPTDICIDVSGVTYDGIAYDGWHWTSTWIDGSCTITHQMRNCRTGDPSQWIVVSVTWSPSTGAILVNATNQVAAVIFDDVSFGHTPNCAALSATASFSGTFVGHPYTVSVSFTEGFCGFSPFC